VVVVVVVVVVVEANMVVVKKEQRVMIQEHLQKKMISVEMCQSVPAKQETTDTVVETVIGFMTGTIDRTVDGGTVEADTEKVAIAETMKRLVFYLYMTPCLNPYEYDFFFLKGILFTFTVLCVMR
jgi:hypothetical protein